MIEALSLKHKAHWFIEKNGVSSSAFFHFYKDYGLVEMQMKVTSL